ncbi:hypothetical protein TSUD_214050 [Trifolium subterraneum]|uniref:DUF6469 domain-containing protein n=1 Tax=Trifolium subterraneum TaxID=3900 RepID=A0A2Z6N785_TRISU|nr:hypothetical protein TSUD_214050 [Trifolium subterraneum]
MKLPEAQKPFKQFQLFRHIVRLKSTTDSESNRIETCDGNYEPGSGDLIAITAIRPRSLNDLKTLRSPYHIAYVNGLKNGSSNRITVLSSKSMEMDIEHDSRRNNTQKLYAVFLMNMITNGRIWKALNTRSNGDHLNIIEKVLQPGLNIYQKDFAMKKNSIIAYAYRAYKRQGLVMKFEVFVQTAWRDITKLYQLDEKDRKECLLTTEQFVKQKVEKLRMNGLKFLMQTVYTNLMQLFEDPRNKVFSKMGYKSFDDFAINNTLGFTYCAYKQNRGKDKYDDSETFKDYVKRARKDIIELYQSIMTMEKFVKQRFGELREKLEFLLHTLYTHMPKSFISKKAFLLALDHQASKEMSVYAF